MTRAPRRFPTAAVFVLCGFAFPARGVPEPIFPGAGKPDPLAPVQALFDQRRFSDVIGRLSNAELQKLERRDLCRAYDLLGLSYQYASEPDRAIGVYELASQLFPKDINILTHLAELLHKQDLDDRARPLYERALRIHPNNASANVGIAEIERGAGLLDQSQGHYERCLANEKEDPSIWIEYAQVLADQRNYPKAAAAIQQSLDLDPANASSFYSLSQFQRRQGLKTEAYATIDKAVAAADAASKYEDIRPELSLRKASWLLEDGRLDESLEEAQSVLYRFPQEPFALWLRASVALRKGDAPGAAADLEEAAGQNRQAPFVAAVAQAMLDDLRRNP